MTDAQDPQGAEQSPENDALLGEAFFLSEVRVDPVEGTIEADGKLARLQPKVMDVLVFLARHHGQIVSKEMLLENVWSGRFVVDDALRRCILRIRKALREDAKEPRFLETLPRRGYRLLVPPVVAIAPDEPPAPAPSAPSDIIIRNTECPFRGLQSFRAEHSSFFFGRAVDVTAVLAALRHQLENNRGFVLLLGPSGSGKSSLARAAVLPALEQEGSFDLPGKRLSAEFLLHTSPQAPLRQFARTLRDTLGDQTPDGEALEAAFERDADEALTWTIGALDQHGSDARLIVLLDQFEEWFSYPDVAEEALKQFIELLYALARSGRIWFVTVMRSEFYPQFMQYEPLRFLKTPAGQVDIGFPRASQIADIVREPARIASLTFDQDAAGRPLDQVLIDAAAASPAGLPLLEFALEQLYQRRTGDVLRHSDLAAIGGLEGSLGKHAEDTFLSVNAEAQAALPLVLEHMLTVSSDLDRVTRRAAPMAQFDVNSPAHTLVTAMIEARLFSTHLDPTTGQPVVQFAHEAVISHWTRARTWIEQNFATLRFLGWLSESAQRWADGGRRVGDLIAGGRTLIEATRLTDTGASLGDVETEFIHNSERHANRRARRWRAVTAAMVILTLAAVGFAVSTIRQSQLAQQRQLTAMAEAERARSTTDFMATLFSGADPGSNDGVTLSATQLLNRGAARIDGALDAAPESKAALMVTIAEAYMFLGETQRARALIESALPLAQDIDPVVSRVPADVSLEMTGLLRETGNYEQALVFARQSEQLADKHGDAWLQVKARNLHGLVLYESGANDDALALLEATLADAKLLATPDLPLLASLHNNIALCHLESGDYPAADDHLTQSIALDKETGSVRHGARSNRLNNLAAVRDEQGRHAEALALYTESINLLTDDYGPSHPQRVRTLLNRGTLEMRTVGLDQAYESFKMASEHSARAHPTIDALVRAKLALCAALLARDDNNTDGLPQSVVRRLADAYTAEHRVVAEANAAIAIRQLRNGPDDEALALLVAAHEVIVNSDDAIPEVVRRVAAELAAFRQTP